MIRAMLAAVLAVAVPLAVLAVPAAAEGVFMEARIVAGGMLYDKECSRCHAEDSDHPSFGPPLVNVIGRGAGTVAGYDYSEALAGSGIVWTPTALRAWMEDNQGFIPGTRMRHVGIEDRSAQDFILAYLGSISAPADGTDGE